jgi:glutamate dehydrogenase
MSSLPKQLSPQERLSQALANETKKFQEYYLWIEKAMPQAFFEEVNYENRLLIVHNLMGFNLQDYFSTIHLRRAALVMCLDSADADLRILKNYAMYGIKNYQSYVSNCPVPFPGINANLRITQIYFTEAEETVEEHFPLESKEELRTLVKQRNPQVTDEEFNNLINNINIRFLRSLPIDRLILVLDMFFRARTRDNCQYEVRYNEDWEEKDLASMQIVLAWKNTPKHHFLYRMARIIHRYGLVMKKVNVAYIDPYSPNPILVMALSLHGSNEQAVWDVADIPDFLREFATVKYFASFDEIDEQLIKPEIIKGKMGNFLRCCINFIHQSLVHIDPHLYSIERIEEDLCRHPELTSQICSAFEFKFDPDYCNYNKYLEVREKFLIEIEHLDTGHPYNDTRRKNVLKQAFNLIHYCYKTNYFRINYTSISFRLDPRYLDDIPFNRREKFPELPYAIFFIKGMHFFGFHIRFKDLARGGVRTVFPKQAEHVVSERNNVFAECYNLAYTQQKKNKDIPEGGAKAIIFLKPFDRLHSESLILKRELEDAGIEHEEIKHRLSVFKHEQEIEYLYQSQRSFIESLLTVINCDSDGKIRAKNVIDYWKRPEYIYLGPDEYMHDSMIDWIAQISKKYDYKPGSSFISGKPKLGINHKEYGVTSLGVNVYMENFLKYLGKDPYRESFTIKMSGGPDGDVAGNQIRNLQKYYPNTAKLVALTDISGTINDPEGLDLNILVELFHQQRPIKFYPPEKLHDGGFLLDRQMRRKQTAYVQQTLCWKNQNGRLVEDWLSGSDMNYLFRHNVHKTKSDVFIPAGGRPRTLSLSNIEDFLDETGKPTSKVIIEGANLYTTEDARQFLEEKGVLIVKDSSANKTGVICSSFEVLCGLTLGDETFLKEKNVLVQEILERLKLCANNEAALMLRTKTEKGGYLIEISEQISERINQFTYQLLDYFDTITISDDPNDPLVKQFLSYALPTLVVKYQDRLLSQIPDHHRKAIIACNIASNLVYNRGLDWHPTIVDVFPILMQNT